MKWVMEASETRSVWPHCVQENIVKLDSEIRLEHNGDLVSSHNLGNWRPGSHNLPVDNMARWNLYELDDPWTDTRLDIFVAIDDVGGFRSAVLPPGVNPYLNFTMMCKCGRTRWRTAISVPLQQGQAQMQLTIPRAQVAGEIQIVPVIVLAEHIQTVSPGWANTKGSILATGFPVYLYADEPEDKPGGGIKIEWQAFPDSYRNALYYLDITEEGRPVLFLNNQYPVLQSIVINRSKTASDRTRLRDALFASIGLGVWMELGAYAASVSQPLTDGAGEPGEAENSELCDGVLKALSRRISWDRESIVASFSLDSGEAMPTKELQRAIQHSLSMAKQQAELVAGIQDKNTGGE